MRKIKIIMIILCVTFMAIGIASTATALTIYTTSGVDGTSRWEGSDPNNPDASDIASIVSYSETLTELYKQDVGGGESGLPLIQTWYETTFYNTATDPEDALIHWLGTNSEDPHISVTPVTPVYLLVKDGSQNPIWYIFNLALLGWDGMDDIYLQGFWAPSETNEQGQGAISHVGIYGVAVPEPTTLILLGVGLLGLAGIRRK